MKPWPGRPVTPNAVTVTGTIGVAASTLWGYPTGHLFLGTLIATLFVFLDMLDGVLARLKGTSGPWGAFLDSTMDRVADAATFSGLAAWFVLGGAQPAARRSVAVLPGRGRARVLRQGARRGSRRQG